MDLIVMRNYSPHILACIFTLALLAGHAGPTPAAEGIAHFKTHIIEEGERSAYKIDFADVNSDGRPDILLTTILAAEPAWYENPGWERHLISDALESTALVVTAADVAGDSTPELFVVAGFSPVNENNLGKIYRLDSGQDPTQPWQHELFDEVFMAHRMYFADLDNDGSGELVVAPIIGSPEKPMAEYDLDTPLYYYPSDSWERKIVTDQLRGTVHGMDIVDWDGQGGDDILTSGFDGIWIHRAVSTDTGGDIQFQSEQLTSGKWSDVLERQGTSDAQIGRLKDGGKFIAAIEPFHGDLVVIYTEEENGASETSWRRHLIDDSISHGHAIVTVDLNGDGIDEVIASGDDTNAVYIYYATDDTADNWRRETLDDYGAQTCAIIIQCFPPPIIRSHSSGDRKSGIY